MCLTRTLHGCFYNKHTIVKATVLRLKYPVGTAAVPSIFRLAVSLDITVHRDSFLNLSMSMQECHETKQLHLSYLMG